MSFSWVSRCANNSVELDLMPGHTTNPKTYLSPSFLKYLNDLEYRSRKSKEISDSCQNICDKIMVEFKRKEGF